MLRPVERHPTELHEAGLTALDQDLVEEPVHPREVPPTEPGERREVRVLVGGEPADGEVLEGRVLETAGTHDPDGVAVEQDLELPPGVEGRKPSLGVAVGGEERLEVEVVDHVRDDVREVVAREPHVEIGGKEDGLARVVLPERGSLR